MADEINIDDIVDYRGFFKDSQQAYEMVLKINTALHDLGKVDISIKGINGMAALNKTINELSAANKVLAAEILALVNARKQESDETVKNTRAKKDNKKSTDDNISSTEKEAKAELESIKNKKELTKYTDSLNKEKDKLGKASEAEIKAQEKLGNAYEQLKAKYNIAANTAKRLAAEELEIIRIHGAGSEAAKRAAQYTIEAQRATDGYYQSLVKIERAVGQSQRTVGQYERAQFALSQVIREAPAFMNSWQTGLSGISNNIPHLIEEYDKLKASTGSTSQAFGILAKSLFSPINLISIGIALLPTIISKIGEWTGSTKSAAEAQKELAEYTQRTNDIIKKQTELIGESFIGIGDLNKRIRSMKEEIDTTEKAGAQQVVLFAKKKALATLEKDLALQKAQNVAGNMGANQAEIADTEKTIAKLTVLQSGYAITISSIQEQLRNRGLSKSKIEALKAEATSLQGTYDNITESLNGLNVAIKTGNDLTSDESKFNADERRKLALETARTEVEIIKAKNDSIIHNEKSTLQERINALQNNQAAQRRIIEADKKDVLNNPEASKNDKIIAIKKAAADEFAVTLDTNEAIFEVKEAFRFRDLQAKKDNFVQQKQIEIEGYNDIKDNTQFSLAERLLASQKAYAAQKEVIEAEYQLRKEQVKNVALTEEEKLQIEKEYENKILKLSIDTNTSISNILKSELDKQKSLRESNFNDIERLYNKFELRNSKGYATEILALNDALLQKEISVETYERKRKLIEGKYQRESNNTLINQLREQLALFTHAEEQQLRAKERVEKLKKDLVKATTVEEKNKIAGQLEIAEKDYKIAKDNVDKKIALDKQLTEAQAAGSDARVKKTKEEAKAIEDLIKQLGNKVFDFVKALGDGGFERETQHIREQILLLEQKKNKDTEFANQTITNADEREREITRIEIRAAAQRMNLENQQRQNQVRQAKFERDAQALKIFGETLLQAAKLGWITPQAILVEAIGAISIATLYAKPLPRYFKGKDKNDPYSGPAIVGDGGVAELIERKSGRYEITPATPTVTNVDAGDVVHKDASEKLMEWALMGMKPALQRITEVQGSEVNIEKLSHEIRQSGKNIVNAIKSQPRPRQMNIDHIKLWLGSNESAESFMRRMNGN